MGFLDRPQEDDSIPLANPASAEIALRVAQEGVVLLKNEGDMLPLDRSNIGSIAVIGPHAHPTTHGGGGSSFTTPFHTTSMFEGITTVAGAGVEVRHNPGESIERATQMARESDVAVVCVGFTKEQESEGSDRTFELPEGQEEIINAVARANRNTVVVLFSGGSVATEYWIGSVPAFLHAWFPGQEGCRAVAEIIFGAVNPSGRLPISFEKRQEDSPAYGYYHVIEKKTYYKEGIFVGYRGFDKKDTEPLFCFGHGLSYTAFTYDSLNVENVSEGNDTVAIVTVDVTNTGKRAGAEVAQLYVQDVECSVPRPVKELKGFQKVYLDPGETRAVTFALTRQDLSFYDVGAKCWKAEPGAFNIMVGNSSRSIHLRAQLAL